MIFSSESIAAIVQGRKTQTRRIVKPNDFALHFIIPDYGTGETSISGVVRGKRLQWAWGQDYAVCSGRGKPGVWWRPDNLSWGLPFVNLQFGFEGEQLSAEPVLVDIQEVLEAEGNCKPLRIRITSIRRERVQDISEEDILAEGFTPLRHNGKNCRVHDWYAGLWDTINTHKGTRWNDNPVVWVLTFEVKQ